MQGYVVPDALHEVQIASTIADLAVAPRNAIAARFDGVRIHGANERYHDGSFQSELLPSKMKPRSAGRTPVDVDDYRIPIRAIETATALPAAAAVAAEADLTSGPFPVTRVVDGDTLWVKRDGQTIKLRLIGIDTPETHDPRKPVQCFGEQASAQAATMLDGQLVLLETLLPSTENADQQSPRMPMILPRR